MRELCLLFLLSFKVFLYVWKRRWQTSTWLHVWNFFSNIIITYLNECYFFLHLIIFQYTLLYLKEEKYICTIFLSCEGSPYSWGFEPGTLGLLLLKIPEVGLREFSAQNSPNQCGQPFWNRLYLTFLISFSVVRNSKGRNCNFSFKKINLTGLRSRDP